MGKNGITLHLLNIKYKIAYIGKNFRYTDFDFNSNVSAWSSIENSLFQKDLFIKKVDPKTDFGTALCQKLFKEQVPVKNEDNSIILLIDSRKIKNKGCRSFFQTYFEGKNIQNETRNLAVGDFI